MRPIIPALARPVVPGLLFLLAACGDPGAAPRTSAPPSPAARALLADLPAAYRGADLANGALEFSLCRSCHTVAKGAPNMTGPNLYGVFGRPVAGLASYAYSSALRSRKGVWDADRLNLWITAPALYAPGTKMSYPGMKDPANRRDVIAYLKLASAGEAPSP